MAEDAGRPRSGARLATVTSLVLRRIKRELAVREVVQPTSGELGNEVRPDSNGSGADLQCPGDIGLATEVSHHSVLAHTAKLSMPSNETQPCLAHGSLSLLYMSSQAWKRCKTLAERLQWSIEHAGKSQADLATNLGISTAGMSEWFTGKVKNPKLHNIFKASQYCKVYGWWLAIGEGTPYDGIGSEFDGISGQDLLIAKDLSQLDDKGLRDTVTEVIAAKRAAMGEQEQKKRKV